MLGESLYDYIVPDTHETDATSFDERTAAGKSNHAIVRRRMATGLREFLYRGVPYEREDGRRFGFAIYSEITEQRTYEPHIKVIYRILRHNLRNELSTALEALVENGIVHNDGVDPTGRGFPNSSANRSSTTARLPN